MFFVLVRRISMLATLATLSFALAGPALAANEPGLDDEEREFLRLINEYRAANSLGPLASSGVLAAAANFMSADMGAKNYFSHSEPPSTQYPIGRNPFERMADMGYAYNAYKGENIAAGYAAALTTFNQWKGSPSHNTNMLNANFKVIGIGRAYVASSTYKWYWTTDFGGFVDPSTDGAVPLPSVAAIVNAASYLSSVARGSIAALFGENLAAATKAASTLPLPKELEGTVVRVNGEPAELFYVSAKQINFFVPNSALPGVARVEVQSRGQTSATFSLNVSSVAAGIFTAKADGKGAAVGSQTSDGVRYEGLTNADGSARRVSAGTLQQPSYIVLYGTGFRHNVAPSDVHVTIGGYDAQVTYAGAQGSYIGLDQMNLKVPYFLRGVGEIELVVKFASAEANRVRVAFE
jgi:uncharacterized protein (TIGR03437 family)